MGVDVNMFKDLNDFISTLDQAQRGKALFAFDDDEQRARWSNLPTTNVRHAGLSMGELSGAQRSAALALLASALSFAWNILSWLAVPYIVIDGLGPVDALKASAESLKMHVAALNVAGPTSRWSRRGSLC